VITHETVFSQQPVSHNSCRHRGERIDETILVTPPADAAFGIRAVDRYAASGIRVWHNKLRRSLRRLEQCAFVQDTACEHRHRNDDRDDTERFRSMFDFKKLFHGFLHREGQKSNAIMRPPFRRAAQQKMLPCGKNSFKNWI
jgi:hypothetical protein